MEFETLDGPGSPEDFLFSPTSFLRPIDSGKSRGERADDAPRPLDREPVASGVS